MSSRASYRVAVWLAGPALIAVTALRCGAGCPSSDGNAADVPDDTAERDADGASEVDGGVDVADGGDIPPDIEPEVDMDATDGGHPDGLDIASDDATAFPEVWDVPPFVPEARDCSGRNECYVELDDGGTGCELPDYVEPRISCEIAFRVWGFGRLGIDWGVPTEPEVEPFAGRTLARDGTEALATVTWYDALSYGLEGWGAACLGHCPYYAGMSLSSSLYLIHVPTGVLVDATAEPTGPFDETPDTFPECEVDGVSPEGVPTGWCWRDAAEFDVRYLWRMEGVELPFTYEGPTIPAAIHRRRLSTGEDLGAIDLPLL